MIRSRNFPSDIKYADRNMDSFEQFLPGRRRPSTQPWVQPGKAS